MTREKIFRAARSEDETRRFPVTDYNYHAISLSGYRGGCARPGVPSFRNISRDYFRKEAGREFCREAIAFAAIVLTAAVPLLNNAHALADFLRAIGGL